MSKLIEEYKSEEDVGGVEKLLEQEPRAETETRAFCETDCQSIPDCYTACYSPLGKEKKHEPTKDTV